jgi:hypothetical protein
MSGNNAPNAVNQPPFPNVHIEFNTRVKCHIAQFTLAAGTPTLVLGTPGVSVAVGSTGQVVITVPAAPAGSLGWLVTSPPSQASPADVTINSASGANNFVTGSVNIVTMVAATATAVTTGAITVMVYTISP